MMSDLARQDTIGAHQTTEEVRGADLFLFVERLKPDPYFTAVRRHPFFRQWPGMCFVFCSGDRALPLVRGVFTSTDAAWYDPAWCRAGPYLGITETEDLRFMPFEDDPPFLFSFVGASDSHPLRKNILSLRDDAALLLDTRKEKRSLVNQTDVDLNTLGEFRSHYARSIGRSHFVLCPRGFGTATFRIFEAMICGRVPVIVSDRWVAPEGPAWPDFSIRIAETDVRRIPGELAGRRDESRAMGARARAAWETWFSPATCFHHIVESCLAIGSRGATDGRISPGRMLRLMTPYHLSRYLAWRFLQTGRMIRGRRPRASAGA